MKTYIVDTRFHDIKHIQVPSRTTKIVLELFPIFYTPFLHQQAKTSISVFHILIKEMRDILAVLGNMEICFVFRKFSQRMSKPKRFVLCSFTESPLIGVTFEVK